ncbi:Alpha/Beta hydrolase protein [Diplogelasinospora grovesii]|uniref:Alpha/Beta hydrolase protein n=1 Tax=Diplogelasinospora grovesii TaxID=303347 RepID=A0AAN6MZD6_9PEZI|nr:Alpha/Beta hydrolase protein [Diplogelasinospora grovesii]
MFSRLSLAAIGISTLVAAAPNFGSSQQRCSSVSFKLSATAENAVFASPPNPENETAIEAFVKSAFSANPPATDGTVPASGTFTINGIYCKPTVPMPHRGAAIQILVHGITYNKTMWSGLGFGDQYDWHKFANAQGYHTLAIDRLGHGLDQGGQPWQRQQYPDPLNVVQGAMHVELAHQLITALRTNNTGHALDRGFDKIAYVGHSYGSFIGEALARVYPEDADALVLTGYSTSLNLGAGSALQVASAANLFPARYGRLPLGYVTIAEETQREAVFYAGAYDKRIPQVDYLFEDTVTDGEIGALAFTLQPATTYKNPVMVVTGALDAFFCGGPGSCESALNATGQFFPATSNFEYYAPADTGHDLTLHYSAPVTLQKVHDFLNKFF